MRSSYFYRLVGLSAFLIAVGAAVDTARAQMFPRDLTMLHIVPRDLTMLHIVSLTGNFSDWTQLGVPSEDRIAGLAPWTIYLASVA